MKLFKTRCKQCINANKKATEKPCNICSEIMYSNMKCKNHFSDGFKVKKIKSLME